MDEATCRHACEIWADHGITLAKGEFVHAPCSRPRGAERARPAWHAFTSYDGERVHLADTSALVPDGLILHPFSTGGGKMQRFVHGKPMGEETEY